MANWVCINGDFTEHEKASLHLSDLAFQRGYGIFDFLRVGGNHPIFLDDHLNRFYHSAEGMHLPVRFSRADLKQCIRELIERNNLADTGIRLSLTGGYAKDGFTITTPNFIISQHSFMPPDTAQIATGIRLLPYPHQRQFSHIKTTDYLMAIWLQPLLREKGFDDALYHQDGYLTECPRSNFFIITKEEVLVTPAQHILKGITRMKVLELAKQRWEVEERAIGLHEVETAKEAFITSTTKQLLPVGQIGNVLLPERKITMELLGCFRSAYFC